MTTVEKIIGRVLSRMRLQDTSYINDMYIWIPQVVAALETRYTLVPKWKDVQLKNNRAQAPSGMSYIDYVTYNGCCVHSSGGKRAMDAPYEVDTTQPTIFISDEVIQKNPVTGNNMYVGVLNDTDLIPPQSWDLSTYYFVEGNYITFSMPSEIIRIFYHGVPTDCNGLPLVPDNDAYHEAAYWYLRRCIIETGYKDPVFNWDKCDQQYHMYAARAIEQLLTDDMAEMDRKAQNIQGCLFHH